MTQVGVQALSGRPVGWAILLILFGVGTIVVAVTVPAGVGAIIAWLIQFVGAFLFIHAVESRQEGHLPWKVVVALLYVTFGLYLVKHPVPTGPVLTLLLTVFFVAEGVLDFAGYIQGRKAGASAWILFDGVITLLLGVLAWRQWPSGSLRAIGILVGISMMTSGTTRTMMSLAARTKTTQPTSA
jgi:uncharacterized membrane protein HdeD (DUF308 family)